jgi:hypothetical protein
MLRHVFLIDRAGTLQIIGILAGPDKHLRRNAGTRRCQHSPTGRYARKNSANDFTAGTNRSKIFIAGKWIGNGG